MGRLVDHLRRKMQMVREDALAVARVVEDAFQGQNSVEDDDLDAQLRQVFYDLQDAKVLDVKRHEYEVDGRTMRGYSWELLDDEARFDVPAPVARAEAEDDVYSSLKEHAWQRGPPRHV